MFIYTYFFHSFILNFCLLYCFHQMLPMIGRRSHRPRLPYVRQHPTDFHLINDDIFRTKYRFTKAEVRQIVNLLSPILPHVVDKGYEITTENQVATRF
jgi:hypothetical protein